VVFWIAMLASGFMFFAYSLTRRTRGVEIDMRTEFWMNFVSGNGSDFLTVDAEQVFFT